MANRWLPYARAPVNTRLLLQHASGYITIGRYHIADGTWVDDSLEDIAVTRPDDPLLCYRHLPKPTTRSAPNPQEEKTIGDKAA